MKKLILFFIAVWFNAISFAQSSGTLGELTWSVSTDTLTVKGIGAIPDFSIFSLPPWLNWSLEIKHIIISNGITRIGDWAFFSMEETLSIELPNSIYSIGEGAFLDCYALTTFDIPNSVKRIGGGYANGTFENSGLTTITIPNSVTYIGPWVFANCKALATINIPNSVDTIGFEAFKNCISLTAIDIPNSVKYCSGFVGCTNLNSINLSDSLEFMPLFMGCSSLKTLKIPDKASYVDGFGNFIGCDNLTSFTVGDNHLWYFSEDGVLFSKDVYNGQSQLSVFPPGKQGEYVIPDHVIQLAQGAFYSCKKITSIVIPNSVKALPPSIFKHCSNLNSIDIPSSIKTIGDEAFYNCTNLDEIKVHWEDPSQVSLAHNEISTDTVFKNIPLWSALYVPKGTKQLYRKSDIWKRFLVIEEYTGSAIPAINSVKADIYPNPVKDYFYIQSEKPVDKIEIYDQSGVCVLINTNFAEKTDVSRLSEGLYLIRIYTDGIPETQKIIIKR